MIAAFTPVARRRVVLITVQHPLELRRGAARALAPGDPVSNNPNNPLSSPVPVNPRWAQGEGRPPDLIPPELPPELLLPEGADEVLRRLEAIWLHATPDTIGRDLESARRLAGGTQGEDAEVAQRYVTALSRLEHWLHDR